MSKVTKAELWDTLKEVRKFIAKQATKEPENSILMLNKIDRVLARKGAQK